MRYLVLILAVLVASAPVSAQKKLSTSVKSTIVERVIPAYRSDDALSAIKLFSPLVARMNDEQVAAVDALLKENDVPESRQLITEARLTLMRFGQVRGIPSPRGTELRLLSLSLDERIDRIVAKAEGHRVMATELPSPKDLEEYEGFFWDAHVLGNELINVRKIAVYGLSTADGKKGQEDLDVDFQAHVAKIERIGVELSLRRVEMHLQRLELAQRVLSEEDDLRLRILAAYSIDFDAPVLRAFLKENETSAGGRPQLARERLAEDGLDQRVAELIESGEELAGDLRVKSRLFFEGRHWWMRGRYGRGAEQGGLMKSRYAMNSMQAQMALHMPVSPPEPLDPFGGQSYQTPEVDRRHHYNWTTEEPRFRPTTAYFH